MSDYNKIELNAIILQFKITNKAFDNQKNYKFYTT